MKTFIIGQFVRINTPGESAHGQKGTVASVGENRVYVNLGDVVWMYFHDEVDILN